MAPRFRYTRPSDDLIVEAAIAIGSGIEDPDYPKENIQIAEPDRPAKLTGNAGSFVYDLGTALRQDAIALINHNLAPTATLRLQVHSADVWTDPDIDEAITIPEPYADGFTPNLLLDLKTLVPDDADRTRRFGRVLIAGNTAPVSIGCLRVEQTLRDLDPDEVNTPMVRGFLRPAKIHETDTRVRKRYDLGTTLRTLRVTVDALETVQAALEAWWRDAQGAVRPFLVIPRSGTGAEEPWLVTFTEPETAITTLQPDWHQLALEFIELSRGLAP